MHIKKRMESEHEMNKKHNDKTIERGINTLQVLFKKKERKKKKNMQQKHDAIESLW